MFVRVKALNIIALLLTVFLIAGIILGSYAFLTFPSILWASCTLIIIFILAYFKGRKWSLVFSITGYLLISCFGFINTRIHQPQLYKDHYEKLYTKDDTLELHIHKVLKPNTYFDRYVAKVSSVNGINAQGFAIINIKKDSTDNTLPTDAIIFTNSVPYDIGFPLNPHQFNYKRYLQQQYISQQLYLEKGTYQITGNKPFTISGYAAAFRGKTNHHLNKYQFNKDVITVINALLLGQRQHISEGLYQNYIDAGAVHILAISGLHIGIILFILQFILSPLRQLKNGKILSFIIILSVLWAFAFIAGLSASVVRAVTMFSFFAYTIQLRKRTNTINVLVISMFFLLLFKPNFLFDVGFQLSYVAVLSIILIQPVIYSFYDPKWKVVGFFWGLFTVSLAAQIGVAPIGLYYFHQFPGLFFVSNLLIVPFLGLILCSGVVIICLAWLRSLPGIFVETFNQMIASMNSLVTRIAGQEAFIFKDIKINETELFLLYLFIIITVYALGKPSKKSLSIASLTMIFTVFVFYTGILHPSNKDRTIIFHQNRRTLIAYTKDNVLYATANDIEQSGILQNYCLNEHIDSMVSIPFQRYLGEKELMVVDSSWKYSPTDKKGIKILLTQSPRINLERLIDSIRPIKIIADGNNYKSFVERWKATCRKRKLPFHYTGAKGAYIIE